MNSREARACSAAACTVGSVMDVIYGLGETLLLSGNFTGGAARDNLRFENAMRLADASH